MVQLGDADPYKFSNIHLFKGSRHDSIASLFMKNTDFDLRKVKDLGQMKDKVNNFMKKDKGLFLCVLAG